MIKRIIVENDNYVNVTEIEITFTHEIDIPLIVNLFANIYYADSKLLEQTKLALRRFYSEHKAMYLCDAIRDELNSTVTQATINDVLGSDGLYQTEYTFKICKQILDFVVYSA